MKPALASSHIWLLASACGRVLSLEHMQTSESVNLQSCFDIDNTEIFLATLWSRIQLWLIDKIRFLFCLLCNWALFFVCDQYSISLFTKVLHCQNAQRTIAQMSHWSCCCTDMDIEATEICVFSFIYHWWHVEANKFVHSNFLPLAPIISLKGVMWEFPDVKGHC